MMQESNPDGKAKNRKSPGRLTVRRGICSIKLTVTTRVASATEKVPSHEQKGPLNRCQVTALPGHSRDAKSSPDSYPSLAHSNTTSSPLIG